MTVGRNDLCPCGSGKKFKKCCAAKGETTTAGLEAAIRMKGGISFDPAANAYRAIVHSWDNASCIGEPQEWQSTKTFPSEDAAMTFYTTSIRPELERLVAEACRKVKDGASMHRRLE
jgi:hypothetical protein